MGFTAPLADGASREAKLCPTGHGRLTPRGRQDAIGAKTTSWGTAGLQLCRPRAVRRRVGGRGNEWFDEELSERRVSYESAVPELPAVAVSREPEASINSDLAGNDAICSTCPSRPSP